MATKPIATLSLTLLLFTLCSTASVPCNPKIPMPKIPRTIPPKMPPPNPFCPRDTVKFGACLDLLGDKGGLVIGAPLGGKCCPLLQGLTDAEAAACLCTTVKESVLGITVKWSVAVSLMASGCKKEIPDGFKCI